MAVSKYILDEYRSTTTNLAHLKYGDISLRTIEGEKALRKAPIEVEWGLGHVIYLDNFTKQRFDELLLCLWHNQRRRGRGFDNPSSDPVYVMTIKWSNQIIYYKCGPKDVLVIKGEIKGKWTKG